MGSSLTITARARRDLLMLSVFFLAIFLGARAEAAPDPATYLHINKAIIDLQDSKDQDSKAGKDYFRSDYQTGDYKTGISKLVEMNLGKGLKVPVQMPEAMHSQAKFTVNPSAGLILDLINPSKTQWEKAQIEMNGKTVPLKINVGVFTFRLKPNQGIFLGANTGAEKDYFRSDYQIGDYKTGISKLVEINLGKDWKGLKVLVQMPEALSSKASFKVNPNDGLILDLVNPSKTQWEKAQIEWNGQTVPLKINVGVFTFRLSSSLGIFLGANAGTGVNPLPERAPGRNDYQGVNPDAPPKPWNLERDCQNYHREPNKELFKWCVDESRAEYWRKVKKENDYQGVNRRTFTLGGGGGNDYRPRFG